MRTRTIWVVAAATLLGNATLHAQDIAGVWEGTITAGGASYRQLMKIAKADTGWTAVCYSLDDAVGSAIRFLQRHSGHRLRTRRALGARRPHGQRDALRVSVERGRRVARDQCVSLNAAAVIHRTLSVITLPIP
jgi:hypothetical protein